MSYISNHHRERPEGNGQEECANRGHAGNTKSILQAS